MLNNLITKPSSRNQYPFFPNLLKLIWIIWNLDLEKSFTGLTIFTIICLQCIQKWRGLKMKTCLLCLPVLMKTKLKLKLKRLQVRVWKRNGFINNNICSEYANWFCSVSLNIQSFYGFAWKNTYFFVLYLSFTISMDLSTKRLSKVYDAFKV